MKTLLMLMTGLLCSFYAFSQEGGNFSGLNMNMGNLSRLSDAKTRSISPENFTGEKERVAWPIR